MVFLRPRANDSNRSCPNEVVPSAEVVGADIGAGNVERCDPLGFHVGHTGLVLQRSYDAQNRAVMDHGTLPKIHPGIKDSLTVHPRKGQRSVSASLDVKLLIAQFSSPERRHDRSISVILGAI
jgi:hypothetical protein